MLKKIFIGFVLFTMFSFAKVFSQTINKQKLDSLFNILAEKNKAMGSVAISKNGVILYSRAIGYSAISGDEKKPATDITKYRIGSISKMFTTTIIFQLIEEGRLRLTTTLSTYFPTLPNAGKITIGNLLNHRSGLHNFTDDADYTSWMLQAKKQKEMLAIIGRHKVDFEPNEKAAYSNSNFVVLGFIIEKICRKNYATILRQRITARASLLNTYYGGVTNTSDNESFSYRFFNDWVQQPETNMRIPGGAGALVSTPTDLTKFIEALFSLKFITANSLAQMKTITDGYGMGMFQLPFYNKKAFGHNGGIDGFLSNLAYFPEDSLAVAYCTNGQVYPLNDILIGVLSGCFNKDDYLIPTFKTVAVSKEDAANYTGVYSSTQLPLKITISWDNTTLFAQATGQSAFPLEAIEKDKFKFDQAGVKIDFDTDKNEFTLKQGGASYLFTKNK